MRKSDVQQMNIQWNPYFLNLQWKRKSMRKIGEFEKSEVKVECSGEEWETTFGSSYREASQNEGSTKSRFHCSLKENKQDAVL